MSFAHAARLLARRLGIEVHRYKPTQSQHARLFRLLNYHEIDSVLDVGANDGDYARLLRQGGFQGKILSFEPLENAHRALCRAAEQDPNWYVAPRMALGMTEGEVSINVSQNSKSSSILAVTAAHISAAPQSTYVGVQRVPLRRLDTIRDGVIERSRALFLKVDAQGYEMPILKGAENLLPRIHGAQLELSLTCLYEGQEIYREMIEWLTSQGFDLWNVLPGFSDPTTGRMLQMDGVFFRSLAPNSK